jgi:hypothetical protein
MTRSPAEEGSLASLAPRALGWSFASNATARFGVLPIGVVLARMLGPHAFGTYAVELVALIALPASRNITGLLPVYRDTVAALSWDPRFGSWGRNAVNGFAWERRHARDLRWIWPTEGSQP